MNKTIFRQADSRWGSLYYPTKASNMAGFGCGCVSCVHVLIEQEQYKKMTPKDLRPYMVKKGYAVAGAGTSWAGIKLTLEHYNNTVINHASLSSLFNTLDTRKSKGLPCLGVILFKAGTKGGITWTAGGHFVAFTDYKKVNGKHYLYTKDSGGRKNDGWHCYETQMRGLIPQVWSALPKTSKSKVTTTTTKKKSTTTTTKKKTTTTKKPTTTTKKSTTKKVKYPGPFPNKTLRKGSKGKQVKYLQKFLNWYGDYGVKEAGTFGDKTYKSVRDFQKKEGLIVDGIVGIKTINKMQTVKKTVKVSTTTTKKKTTTTKKSTTTTKKKTTTTTTTTTKKKTTTTTTKKVPTVKKGIDISAWQDNISLENFKKIKNDGIQFVILRVGFTGSSSNSPSVDSVFENNYKNAIAAGFPVGVYYYSLATDNTMAQKEADFVIKKLKGKQITYPVYIDIEDPNKQGKASKTTLAGVANTFCKAIKNAGYKPGVYASLSWFNDKIGEITAEHSKWVAQYHTECQYKGKYDMWQYTSSGKVNGISGNVDMNYWYD